MRSLPMIMSYRFDSYMVQTSSGDGSLASTRGCAVRFAISALRVCPSSLSKLGLHKLLSLPQRQSKLDDRSLRYHMSTPPEEHPQVNRSILSPSPYPLFCRKRPFQNSPLTRLPSKTWLPNIKGKKKGKGKDTTWSARSKRISARLLRGSMLQP